MSNPVTKSFSLEVPGAVAVTAKISRPEEPPSDSPALVLAHGANNDLDHPLLVRVAEGLARIVGASVLRFNFPYAERGDKPAADRPEVLLEAFRSAHAYLAESTASGKTGVFVGGKSLGGRIAAELVSRNPEGDGLPSKGLVELGYPLHAPGRTDKVNLKPLRHIDVPSLFCEGTRDPFCDLDLLRPVLSTLLVPAELYVVEGGDHSLRLPKSSGKEPEAIYDDVTARIADFLRSAATPRP